MKGVAFTLALLGMIAWPAPARCAASPIEQVRQKAALLDQLLQSSPAAKRIGVSNNPDARRLVEQAAEGSRRAAQLMQDGDTVAADQVLNEAIKRFSTAGQMVPDNAHLAHEDWARHARLIAAMESLHGSYRKHLAAEHISEAQDRDASAVNGMMERARAQAAAGDVAQANRLLMQAESQLLAAFKAVLKSNTINYTPHFVDARDEYQFELDRNRSFAGLVPIAVEGLRPSADAMQRVDQHVRRSRAGRERAEQLAAARDFTAALAAIREANAGLQLALAAAGLHVPKELDR